MIKGDNSLVSIINRNKIVDGVALKAYTTYLKRVRKKKKLIQSDVSTGVCTVSYYSRIENGQVHCDESYLVNFFKNLNVDFYSLKESKNYLIFEDLAKAYLYNDLLGTNVIIDNAIKGKFYAEEEYSLMLLYQEVLKGNLKNATALIKKLGEDLAIYDDLEQEFYLFTLALYFYKTKQIKKTIEKLDQIITGNYTSLYFKYVSVSLMLDIRTYLNDFGCLNYYFEMINSSKFLTFYPHVGLKHEAQKLYAGCNKENYSNTIMDIALIKDHVNNIELENYLTYLIVKCSIQFADYNNAYEILKTIEKVDAQYILYLGYLAYLTNNEKIYDDFNNLYDSYTFLAEEKYIHEVCSSLRFYFLKDYNTANSILKEVVTESEINNFETFISLLNCRLLMDIGLELGRYKEIVVALKPLVSLKGTFIY